MVDRRVSMEATPELRKLLRQRLQIVEGTTSGTGETPRTTGASLGAGVSGLGLHAQQLTGLSGNASIVRLPSQRVREVAGRGGSAHIVRGPVARTPLTAVVGSPLAGAAYDARTAHNLEMRVGALTLRNEQLTQEVEKMKDKLLEDEGALFSEERDRLLAETDELLAETDRMTARSQEMVVQRAELQAAEAELDKRAELHARQMRLRDEQEEAARAQGCSGQAAADDEVCCLRKENEELRQANSTLEREGQQQRELAQENERLKTELVQVRMEQERLAGLAKLAASAPPAPAVGSCSESRLRAVMTSHSTTPEQLRQAIGGVEALLEEARRELAAKQLRERRAAFEQLHSAIEKADEALLAEAVAAARAAEVEQEDVQKGEAKLAELRALTAEERAARAMRELEAKRKKEAFLLVKKDDAAALVALLDSLAETVRWQDWRDYAGRTMWRCARELRAARAQKVLSQRLGLRAPEETQKLGFRLQMPVEKPPQAAAAAGEAPPAPAPGQPSSPGLQERPAAPAVAEAPFQAGPGPPSVEAPTSPQVADAKAGAHSHRGPSPAPEAAGQAPAPAEEEVSPLAPEEEEKLKARALRAVVQDDFATLGEILELAPVSTWSRWENRAGKDLLTLSQERGSSCAYSVLAKALGMMKEMKREAFEERETVWVFLQGEVQPRRATVLEDTPEEADDILVEYWDGDAPPEHVERCMVRRMWS